jgi:hypothetical protein
MHQFGTRWVVVTTLGGAVGGVVGIASAPLTAGLGLGVCVGAAIGTAQWRMLRPRGLRARSWIVPSIVGSIVPGWLVLFAVVLAGSNGGMPVDAPAAYILGVSGSAAVFGAVPGAMAGVLIGVSQWRGLTRIIRPQDRPSLSRWLIATTLGWAGSWTLAGIAGGLLMSAGAVPGALQWMLLGSGVVGLASCWAVLGALTGRLLDRLARTSGSEEVSPLS